MPADRPAIEDPPGRGKEAQRAAAREAGGEKKRAPVQIYRRVWLDGKTWAIPECRPLGPSPSRRYECVSEYAEANLT